MPKTKSTEKRYPITINLLKQLRFEASPTGKTAYWILTVGKAGVLFTFSIFAVTLLYRFALDRKIESTREKIKEHIATVQSYDSWEHKIRVAHQKLNFIQSLKSNDYSTVLFFQKIESSLPKDIYLETLNVSYDSQSIQLKGKALNETVFSQMLNALRKHEEFSEISIDQIQSGGTINPEITFTMNILITKQ